MTFPLRWPLLLIVVCMHPAFADSTVGIAPVPDWVKELELRDFSKDRSRDFQQGVAYLLKDRQVRKSADGYDYAERIAYKVVDRSGLEAAARVMRVFDPEDESLAFNFIRVWRDGELIDQLTKAEIAVLRQEEGLEVGLIDGNLTALVELEDLRVGDVVDYSLSGSLATRLWPEEYFEAVVVEWPMPIAELHFRLVVPEATAVEARSLSTSVEAEIHESDGWKSFELHLLDPDPVRVEQNVPDDRTALGLVAFTTMESWSDVVEWAIPLFSFEEELPSDFVAKLDAIAERHSAPGDRAVHALRLVQEDIRYLGFELGLGSHVPRPPSLTIERGYGDCKDKSVLLVSALRHLGIDAFPALASTMGGQLLRSLPPSIGEFDHVIVGVDLSGETLWVDPTLSHQGGDAGRLSDLAYGYVLPVRQGQDDLAEIVISFPDEPTYDVLEVLEVPESGETGLRIAATLTHRGFRADLLRQVLANVGERALGRNVFDYYAALYRDIAEDRPITVRDDLEANELVVTAQYSMDAESFRQRGFDLQLPVSTDAVQGIVPAQVEADRLSPLALPYGANVRHTVRISMPGRRMSLPRDRVTSAGGVEYAWSYRRDGDAFEMEAALSVTEKVAALDEIPAVTALGKKIVEDSELRVRIGAAVPTLSKRLGLDQALDQATEETVMTIRSEFARRDFIKALTSLNALLEIHDEPSRLRGYLQQFKGVVLVNLSRNVAAIDAFSEGFELHEPTTPESYFAYVDALSNAGEYAQAARTIGRMLDTLPEASHSMSVGWLRDFQRYLGNNGFEAERAALLVSVARAAHASQSPLIDDLRWAFAAAVDDLIGIGDVTEALELLPYVDDPDNLAYLMASRASEALWSDVEKLASLDLSTAVSDYVSSTRSVAAAAPDNFERQTRHLTSLRIAGLFQKALDFGKPIVEDWPRIAAAGSSAFWFVNQYASVLADAGYPEKGDALLARLVDLGVPQHNTLISMAINRAGRLMNWGKFEEALSAVDHIENLDRSFASDYGWMAIYQIKACSLYQLGEVEKARAILFNEMGELADANPRSHTKAMLCLNEFDRAADLIVDRLADEDDRRRAILSFVEVDNAKDGPTFLVELRERAAMVKARPEVQAAFNQVARKISIRGPVSYWGDF